MNPLLIIAVSEVKTLFKEKIFFLLLGVFVCMTLASSFIGWSTYTTTNAIYNASIIFLHQHGVAQVPLNPVLSFPALASFRNIIVYMFLIGSLMAIVIGNRSFIRERKSGALQLLFTRPISRSSLLLGKILGICFALFCIISLTALVSIISSYFLPLHHLTTSDIIRLLVFYGYSFFYILLFAFLGLLFAIVAKSESFALFIPVCIWVVISFIMPELVTGQTPTALLNPVTIDNLSAQGGFFSLMQQFLAPVAVGWHFTSLGSQLLNATADTRSAIDILLTYKNSVVVLAIALIGSYLLCFSALQKYDVQGDVVNE
jgi:ABC-type transport system involved in multi-copper enzyme maturation permease subunit